MNDTPPLRIAIVQQPMAWTTPQNVAHIVTALAFWPWMVGNPPRTIHRASEDMVDLRYVKRTAVLAQRLNAHVVQSNGPQPLNTPESTYLGESKAHAPDGEILLTLPPDEAGVGVFTLGERAFRWTPLPA